jgi:hypothetical protein
MSDIDPKVRKVACLTLGQFSEHLQPEILEHHEKIVPLIFQAMNENNQQIQERSCYALVAFVEGLEEQFLPYIEPLLNRLVELLKVSSNKDIQEMAISGISACAQCAGKKFFTLL